jgi:hypothetical protein
MVSQTVSRDTPPVGFRPTLKEVADFSRKFKNPCCLYSSKLYIHANLLTNWMFRSLSSDMWHRAVLSKRANVTEERTASFFRVVEKRAWKESYMEL